MLTFLETYGRNYKYSQNMEEGILEECLRRMNILSGNAVEVGASDGTFCSNTALLLDKGWQGTLIEAEWGLYLKCFERWVNYPNVKCQCSRVDGHNINAFVKNDCDLLSLDLDGPDYSVFQGLKAKPKIVIVEIDSSIPPNRLEFNADGGAGYGPMCLLGMDKGYFLLCHTGNLIFIDDKYRRLFPEVVGDPGGDSEYYFNRSWLKEDAA